MSNPSGIRSGLTVPRGDVVGTYETYPEAQAVVDRLAKAEFDVSQVAIIGNDLKTVERVTGKLSWGRAALSGAANGAFIGLFFALLLTLFNPDVTGAGSLRLIAAVFLVTAGVGVVLGLIAYAFTRRRRDFASTQQVLASNYQVVVPTDTAARAQQLLAASPTE
ncbi:MAG: hypothetical protein J7480_01820 [Microbacteriaceae bacterium]|nr:hypothetical protein [Microbacteriaceae bacterium]